MKLHIDTAPVWEAYRTDCECPLCLLQAKVEAASVDYFLGESVMEPSQRIEVNEKGFCGRHFKRLYDVGNRLGLALMTDTHMRQSIRKLEETAEKVKAAANGGRSGLSRLLGRGGTDALSEAAQAFQRLDDSCALCERVHENMERYIYTLLYMYRHEPEFPKLFAASKGMCMKHLGETLEMAPKHLPGETLGRFVAQLMDLQLENMKRVEGELDWFTRKFDYRNDDKPWGNSRDAVPRAINKLRTQVIDDKNA